MFYSSNIRKFISKNTLAQMTNQIVQLSGVRPLTKPLIFFILARLKNRNHMEQKILEGETG